MFGGLVLYWGAKRLWTSKEPMSAPAKLIPEPTPRRPPRPWSGPFMVLGVLAGVVESLGVMVGATLGAIVVIAGTILGLILAIAGVILGLYLFLVLIKTLWRMA